jgi:hypothetical protein
LQLNGEPLDGRTACSEILPKEDDLMSETDASIAPDLLLPYFERYARGGGPESEFVRGLAIIHRWQAMASADTPDRAEFYRLVKILESEQDPGSGWYDLWKRTVAWGVANRLIEPRSNPWAKP